MSQRDQRYFTRGLFFAMVFSFILVNFIREGSFKRRIIDGDGSGLYAYLPALLIHKSVDFTPVFEFEKQRRSKDYQGHYFNRFEDILINKFTCGTALMELPAFIVAWILSLIFGLSPDGYNILFQYGVALSAFFWVFMGLVFFVKLARLYQVDQKTAWMIAFAGLFGTNLFYYTFWAPAASHAYSFAAISIFLFYLKKTFIKYNQGSLFASAFLFGLVVLIRPVNIVLAAAIPFIAGSPKIFVDTIKQKLARKDYIFTLLLFILAILSQLTINFLQTGRPFVYGYKNEGFFFDNPQFVNFLVSYRKGWFVYTPLMMAIIPGIFYLWRRSRFEFYSFLGFFVTLIYVFASWWNWLYGNSFGMRPMVDFYALFLLIIAIYFDSLKQGIFRGLMIIFIFICILLNLFQTSQYTKGIIHYDSMTKDAYWYVFLKSDMEYAGVIGDHDEYYYGSLSEEPFFETHNDFSMNMPGWTSINNFSTEHYEGKQAVKMDTADIYSPTFEITIPDSLLGMKNIYTVFETGYAEPMPNAALHALFVVGISNSDSQNVFYKSFRLKRLPDDEIAIWKAGIIGFKLPEITNDMKQIKLYVWNRENTIFYLSSFDLSFYTYGF